MKQKARELPTREVRRPQLTIQNLVARVSVNELLLFMHLCELLLPFSFIYKGSPVQSSKKNLPPLCLLMKTPLYTELKVSILSSTSTKSATSPITKREKDNKDALK